MMRFKNMLKCFSKTEVQEDERFSLAPMRERTLPNKRLSIVCERKLLCERSELSNSGEGYISCAEHTEKHLFSYSPIHLFTSKKVAFTLAEVLITLAIIGVVAAMTLPSIITDYQKKVTIKKLKTTYNILNNAIEMAKTEYGTDVNSWDMPDTNDSKILSDYFAEHYMLPYLKVVQDCKNISVCRFYGYSIGREFVLSNGAIVVVIVTGVGKNVQNVRTQIYIYINGKVKNLNPARDRFLIELGGFGGLTDKNKFWPYGYGSSNCEIQKNIGNTACNKTAAKYRCFALIMCEGWKIPDDYPW